jgi:hypothetical protein
LGSLGLARETNSNERSLEQPDYTSNPQLQRANGRRKPALRTAYVSDPLSALPPGEMDQIQNRLFTTKTNALRKATQLPLSHRRLTPNSATIKNHDYAQNPGFTGQ